MLRRTFIAAALAAFLLPAPGEAKQIASWYGPKHHNRQMANGCRFNQWGSTVASPDLPFGTVILIRNLENNRSAKATVEDRGPYIRGRSLDVSRGIAHRLGMTEAGLASIKITVLRLGKGKRTRTSC